MTDTCGVNNLHGMPSLIGGLLSVLMAGLATPAWYDQDSDPASSSLHQIFPKAARFNSSSGRWEEDEVFWGEGGWSGGKQVGDFYS